MSVVVVSLGKVPLRVFRDRERAREWIDSLDADKRDNLTIWWPVEEGDQT